MATKKEQSKSNNKGLTKKQIEGRKKALELIKAGKSDQVKKQIKVIHPE